MILAKNAVKKIDEPRSAGRRFLDIFCGPKGKIMQGVKNFVLGI
jgi:hypothetical protein